jgi:glycogen(starch) synthase
MTTDNITFSVIVSTLDRANSLATLLHSLEHQSYPYFEIIVVIGPTQDNTLEVLRKYNGRIKVVHCPTANLGQSRNIGLLAARGDVVAFIDDDAIPCHRWLEQLARLFQNSSLDATGGTVYTIHPNHSTIQHRLGIASCLAEQVDVLPSRIDSLMILGRGTQWLERMMGTNMAFRREPLIKVGGFDEFYQYIAEETDLVFRMINAGMEVHPVKEAVVYHVPASSRNRTVFTHQGRWWLRSRSRIYFAIKNGKAAGEPARAIIWQSLRALGAHGLWYIRLVRARQLSLSRFFYLAAMEIVNGIDAAWHGLFTSRQLLNSKLIDNEPYPQSIHQYQNAQSHFQPSIDPINGNSSSIVLSTPPLRICLLSNTYPPLQYDGIGRHTSLLARGLFELGHTVHVITHGDRERVVFYDGAFVHQIPYALSRYERYKGMVNLYHALNRSHAIYNQVRRLILNDGIQVVDSPLWLFEGLVTAISGLLPVVVHLQTGLRQTSEINHDSNLTLDLMGEMEKMLLERAAFLIPNTFSTVAAIQKAYNILLTPERYRVVPYGIIPVGDEAIRSCDPRRISDKWTILYVGRLEKRKGINDLFQAIPQVLKQVPQARFVIAGADNSYHDGFQTETGMDYPTYFARHYSAYQSHVTFLGSVSDEKLADLYQSCDLFVAPSRYESFGLIYLEAMNYAKPVVGCRTGGVPEVVDDGVTGRLVEPGTPSALAAAIVSLLNSPKQLREMGLAGRQRLLERFTYTQMARQFAEIYQKVIADFNACAKDPTEV